MVNIAVSHTAARGSIPRIGSISFLFFFLVSRQVGRGCVGGVHRRCRMRNTCMGSSAQPHYFVVLFTKLCFRPS